MYKFTVLSLSLLAALSSAFASGLPKSQTILSGAQVQNSSSILGAGGSANYDAGLFTPLESLSYLSETTFTALRHPFFPNYNVRIKKSKFCDTTVNAYTGYIDIGVKHLFFYFFESRSEPDKDDVIFWTNGGPGGSSAIGLFMELGPCRVLNSSGATYHPESWNTNANIFFIDQPAGVGFSYTDYDTVVSTTEEAANDVAAFVSIFFEHFSQFKGRPFHLSGESYGGRYLPLFGSAIYDQNAKLVKAGLTPINLASIMIGNGMTDPFRMYLSYYDIMCTSASGEPFIDIETCVQIKRTLKRCESWMNESCIKQYDAINCGAAVSFCGLVSAEPFERAGKNWYDVTDPCEDENKAALCYPQTKYIAEYLTDPSVRSLLGVDPSVPANFSFIAWDVATAFTANQDMFRVTSDYVSSLLERGVRVLVYVGKNDWICNWIGNERWTLAMEWTGQADFVKEELRDWVVDGKRAGKTRSAKGFTFATIEGAGHMAPFNKPKESLELVQRWMAGKDL